MFGSPDPILGPGLTHSSGANPPPTVRKDQGFHCGYSTSSQWLLLRLPTPTKDLSVLKKPQPFMAGEHFGSFKSSPDVVFRTEMPAAVSPCAGHLRLGLP